MTFLTANNTRLTHDLPEFCQPATVPLPAGFSLPAAACAASAGLRLKTRKPRLAA